MAKVSIGLRGWRFEESEVFDEDGDFRPPEELPPDVARRLGRLPALADRPCDACWLIHGDEAVEQCNPAAVVYGEPFAEVVLCSAHEPHFDYWYLEAGGAEYRGTEAFQEAFHEWFAAGNRAPAGYEGLEHVETDPEAVPEPITPDPADMEAETVSKLDLRQDRFDPDAGGDAAETDAGGDAAETDAGGDGDDDRETLEAIEDLDLDVEYPRDRG